MVVLVLLYSALFCLLLHLLLRRLPGRHPPPLPLPPGPIGFPLLGALPLIGPKPNEGLARLAKRYGPLMYLKMGAHGTVVASSPAAARAFLKSTVDAQFANRPSVPSGREITYDSQNLAFSSYGPRWKLLRKLCTLHMLGGRALAEWGPVRRDEVGVLLRSLRDSSETPVVVSDALISTMANIIGRVVLDRRVIEKRSTSEFKDMMQGLLTSGGLFSIGDLVPALAWMDVQGIQKKLHRVHQWFDNMITEMLAEHAASAHEREGRPDFIDAVMANPTDADGETLSDASVKGLIFDMFTAGTDTSKVVMEWALAEMMLNPEIMKRTQSEMDEVVGRDRRLEETDLPSLPYLQAVCKEAFRKHPPTPLGLPHYSSESCEVDGYYVPAKTQLIVNLWAIGRNPDVWEEPLEFRPERFLNGSGQGAENDFELIPFGAGRRVCVGKQAGLLMVQYILGTLVHSFEWKLPDGEKKIDMEEKFAFSLPKAVPLTVLLSPRLAPAAYT